MFLSQVMQNQQSMSNMTGLIAGNGMSAATSATASPAAPSAGIHPLVSGGTFNNQALFGLTATTSSFNQLSHTPNG